MAYHQQQQHHATSYSFVQQQQQQLHRVADPVPGLPIRRGRFRLPPLLIQVDLHQNVLDLICDIVPEPQSKSLYPGDADHDSLTLNHLHGEESSINATCNHQKRNTDEGLPLLRRQENNSIAPFTSSMFYRSSLRPTDRQESLNVEPTKCYDAIHESVMDGIGYIMPSDYQTSLRPKEGTIHDKYGSSGSPAQLIHEQSSCSPQEQPPADRHCSLCNKTFRYPYNLKQHVQKKHAPLRTSTPMTSSAGASTPPQQQQQQPVYQPAYICSVCGLAFSSLGKLHKHRRQHHAVHACAYCDRRYMELPMLKRHVRSCHQYNHIQLNKH